MTEMSLCSFRKKRWELQLKKKNRVHKTHTTETGGHVWRKSRLSELPHSHWIQHTYVAYRWISHSTKRKEKKRTFFAAQIDGHFQLFLCSYFFRSSRSVRVCSPTSFFFPFSSYISKWRELAHRKKILESLLHFTIGKFFIFRSMCVCRLPIR